MLQPHDFVQKNMWNFSTCGDPNNCLEPLLIFWAELKISKAKKQEWKYEQNWKSWRNWKDGQTWMKLNKIYKIGKNLINVDNDKKGQNFNESIEARDDTRS